MPVRHVARFDAPPDAVRAAAADHAGFDREDAGDTLAATLPNGFVTDTSVELTASADDGGTRLELVADDPHRVPYFQWLIGPLARRSLRRRLVHAAEVVGAALEDRQRPAPPGRGVAAPPVAFDRRATTSVATVCAIQAIGGFGAAIFNTNIAFIADSYDASDRALGLAGAVTRVGILVSLVAIALADRRGRRRLLLGTLVGLAVASAISAVAPTLEVFTAGQLLARAFFNANFVIAAVVVIEEAPERARAYSLAMMTLARSAGGALTVALLPLGDVSVHAWRGSMVLSAASLLLVPHFARRLPETFRYTGIAARMADMGRVREVVGPRYRDRFLLLLALALLTNLLAAPASQFTNDYLSDERGFSGFETSLFLAVTGGVPGLAGLLVGGRLAESWGRRRLGSAALAVGAVGTTGFFLADGVALWALGTADFFLAGVAVPAVAAFGPELFPTEVRGTANAVLLVAGVLGSILGLVSVGLLSDVIDLGPAIAVMAAAPFAVALLLVPRLPEPKGKDLDVVSPPLV